MMKDEYKTCFSGYFWKREYYQLYNRITSVIDKMDNSIKGLEFKKTPAACEIDWVTYQAKIEELVAFRDLLKTIKSVRDS